MLENINQRNIPTAQEIHEDGNDAPSKHVMGAFGMKVFIAVATATSLTASFPASSFRRYHMLVGPNTLDR